MNSPQAPEALIRRRWWLLIGAWLALLAAAGATFRFTAPGILGITALIVVPVSIPVAIFCSWRRLWIPGPFLAGALGGSLAAVTSPPYDEAFIWMFLGGVLGSLYCAGVELLLGCVLLVRDLRARLAARERWATPAFASEVVSLVAVGFLFAWIGYLWFNL